MQTPPGKDVNQKNVTSRESRDRENLTSRADMSRSPIPSALLVSKDANETATQKKGPHSSSGKSGVEEEKVVDLHLYAQQSTIPEFDEAAKQPADVQLDALQTRLVETKESLTGYTINSPTFSDLNHTSRFDNLKESLEAYTRTPTLGRLPLSVLLRVAFNDHACRGFTDGSSIRGSLGAKPRTQAALLIDIGKIRQNIDMNELCFSLDDWGPRQIREWQNSAPHERDTLSADLGDFLWKDPLTRVVMIHIFELDGKMPVGIPTKADDLAEFRRDPVGGTGLILTFSDGALRLGSTKDLIRNNDLQASVDRDQSRILFSFQDPEKWSEFGERIEGRTEEVLNQKLTDYLLDDKGIEVQLWRDV